VGIAHWVKNQFFFQQTFTGMLYRERPCEITRSLNLQGELYLLAKFMMVMVTRIAAEILKMLCEINYAQQYELHDS